MRNTKKYVALLLAVVMMALPMGGLAASPDELMEQATGASGAAVQNMNLMLGLDETAGLNL